MSLSSNKSALEEFSESLLTIGDETIVVGDVSADVPIVYAFNVDLFWDKYQHIHPNYNPELVGFGELATHVFKQGAYLKNKTLVRNVLDIVGSVQGWTYTDDRVSLHCNRFGKTKERGKEKQNFDRGMLKIGCHFQIKLKPVYKEMPRKVNSMSIFGKPIWDKPVIIIRQ